MNFNQNSCDPNKPCTEASTWQLHGNMTVLLDGHSNHHIHGCFFMFVCLFLKEKKVQDSFYKLHKNGFFVPSTEVSLLANNMETLLFGSLYYAHCVFTQRRFTTGWFEGLSKLIFIKSAFGNSSQPGCFHVLSEERCMKRPYTSKCPSESNSY